MSPPEEDALVTCSPTSIRITIIRPVRALGCTLVRDVVDGHSLDLGSPTQTKNFREQIA